MTFYTDELFPPRAIELLRSVGASVQTASEARLLGQAAEAHAAHALACGLALFTCDRRFLDDAQFPPQHSPVIFVFHFGDGSLQDIRRAFRCLAPVLSGAPLGLTCCKVDARGDSWTEHVHHPDGTHTRICRRLWRGKLQQWTGTVAVTPP
ncbi:DUF5615 family PIN-like protein [Dyella sp. C9]|uniref:DUF5615 family PIN-like protein n=1 Tax=Dyella sp. C9 TaxID=2202154 RepID=UPI000DEF0841|nr:DUF5615 family PIN-like protein [Dyella sp. C9]